MHMWKFVNIFFTSREKKAYVLFVIQFRFCIAVYFILLVWT